MAEFMTLAGAFLDEWLGLGSVFACVLHCAKFDFLVSDRVVGRLEDCGFLLLLLEGILIGTLGSA